MEQLNELDELDDMGEVGEGLADWHASIFTWAGVGDGCVVYGR